MGKIVNFTQSNLLPLIGALKENTEEGEYTIGMEGNAPVGGEYYHVMDDEDTVTENLEYDLFKGNNLKYNAEKGKYLQYYDIEQEKGLEYYEGLLKQIDDERGEIAKKYGVKPNFFILLTRAKNLKPSFSDIRRFVFLCNKRKFVAKEIELIKNKEEFLRQQKEQAESDKKYYEQKRIDNEIIELAKDEYGLTDDFGQAGYILPDGGLLNFGEGGYRESDHRNIEGVYLENNIKIWDDKYRYNYVVDFMNRGAIRCDLNAGLLDMTNEPTDEQYAAIKNFVRYADSISIDFTSDKGDAEHSVYYSDANAQKVVSDIYKYYNEGIRPQGDTWGENKKYSNLIIESQESKSISAAKKLVMQKLNYNEQEADEFIRIKLRNDIPSLRTPQGGKFILGVTRMFCDGELRNANDIGNLNSTLKLVSSDAHINEYDRNLNGMSCQELIQRFAKAMSNNLEAEKDEINKMVFDSPSDYEIVRIDSFEQAEEYGQYVSWCVTHDENMFNSYTNDGFNQFYFCLKNGFENVEKVKSEGCPLDEYGLSMIAVSVNENGMLNTCTCRWNHDNGGDDSIMNTKEISQVIGMNFFEVFKPNNKWKELLANVMQRLANGEKPTDVFDYADFFKEGFARVNLNNRYNFINQEGRVISSQWFDGAYDFKNGFAIVQLNGKWNFINQEGKILSNQWFDDVYDFGGDFASIVLNGHKGSIDTNGNITLYFQESTETINKNKVITINENQLKKLNENLEFEVDSSDVDLSSFKKQDSLPSIWKDEDTLDSKVRLKLLDIADDFWEYVDVTWVEPKGIIITGSLCNYNWSEYSDVDLHLIVDFNEIGNRKEFVKQYFDSKKNEWNDEHGKLKIYGYPVEIYVQDIDEDVSAGGIYDLEENKWLRKPSYDDMDEIGSESDDIKDKAARIMTIVDDMWDYFNETDDSHKLEMLGDDADSLWKKVKKMRTDGLAEDGEMSIGNIIYKYMRRKKYLDKLFDLRAAIYDKVNTITESRSLLGESDQSLDLFALAKERFGTTYDIRECGYILPDGSMLDFSGRSLMEKGADSSHLRGERHVDHREIYTIGWSEDGNTKNFDIEMDEFIRLGAIRTHVSSSYSLFNLFRKPTKKQADLMMRIIRYAGGCTDVEIGDGYESITSGEYDDANPRRVMSDIIRYFDEGINLMGNVNENITESTAYDKFREGQAFRYRIIGTMIKDGYLFHGTDSEFDEFESNRVRGEERGVYGYGAYFTNAAYKCEEYGNHFLILDADDFEFLNISEKVRPEWNIFKEKLSDYNKIEAGLDNAKSNREYDYYNNLYNEYRSTVDTNLLERFVSILEKNGITDYNRLNKLVDYSFTNSENKDIQKRISELYLTMGYDGFVCENQFIIFNFKKLNDNIVKDKESLIAKYAESQISEIKEYVKVLKDFSLNEEVVADGDSEHNPYAKRWKAERDALKNFLKNFGQIMTSKENGKQYKVFQDQGISNLIGYNYCICIQWDPIKMEVGSTPYIRAMDKFTRRIFQAQFDDRGRDNERGTSDDVNCRPF